ncbi:hypothetical protein [uncultured Porphyromonas sp.]|uniref:hypothetical protein n=2 Tax=Porphyromonas TaxID=836 RepID=UPI00258CA579|nr:hypothetical protein [uncultured Porphyromonas sp.]
METDIVLPLMKLSVYLGGLDVYADLTPNILPPRNKIATEEKQNIQVAIFYSPRGDETIPPKFHLIPPKFHLTSTWRIVFLHVEIPKYPRGNFQISTWISFPPTNA